jgi:O-antigen/teichoic acid export membrane protein
MMQRGEMQRGDARTISALWRNATRLLGAANRQIFANASALMGTMVVTSGFGALYWLLAARLFTTEVIGLSGASIAMMSLLGNAGMLGLGTLLIGELPRQRGEESALVATALAVSGLVGGLLGALFAVGAPLLAPNLRALSASPATVALFALGVGLTSATMVLDQALIGLLRGSLQLWRNAGFAVAKLIVLALVALQLGGESWLTIYATWAVGHLLSLVGLGGYAAWRGLRPAWHALRPRWALLRRFGRAALWHHGLNMALQLPGLALPVLVTGILSATDNAYYYASSIVATPFFYGTLALVTALYAVGSPSGSPWPPPSRATWRSSPGPGCCWASSAANTPTGRPGRCGSSGSASSRSSSRITSSR